MGADMVPPEFTGQKRAGGGYRAILSGPLLPVLTVLADIPALAKAKQGRPCSPTGQASSLPIRPNSWLAPRRRDA